MRKEFHNPVGIWLDLREAIIVYARSKDPEIFNVISNIDESHAVGGSRSATPYGPQEAVSENRHLHRRQHQEKQYYQTILEKIKEADGIYLLGPALAKQKLAQEIEKYAQLKNALVEVQPCDRITLNQLKAKIKDYFQTQP